jgi:hypothetical protein
LAEECVDRNIEFSLGYQIDERVRDGVICVPTGCWHPAIDADGGRRDGAEVVELTEFVNLDAWPTGTRLIVRRERPHPGAQLSLFDTIEGFRHTAFITNTAGYDIAALELRQRQRARAENAIRDAKATGLANMPFDDIVNNDVWMQLCFTATDCSTSQRASPRPDGSCASIVTGPGPRHCSTPSPASAPPSHHSPWPATPPLRRPYERSGLGIRRCRRHQRTSTCTACEP